MIRFLKTHWTIAFLLVVTLVQFGIVSLGTYQPDEEETELIFADRMTAAHLVLIDEYNRLHEGRVRIVAMDFPNPDFTTDERKEIIARSLRGEGSDIDLLAVDLVWSKRFAKWCEPLDGFLSESEVDAIAPEHLASCRVGNDLVAVPLFRVQGMLYYREDLLRRIPGNARFLEQLRKGVTWNDFVAWGRQHGAKGPYYVFPAADYEGLMCEYVEFLLSLDAGYFERVGFRFDTPDARTALAVMKSLLADERVTPLRVTGMTEVSSYDYWLANDGLFLRGWTSYPADFPLSHADSARGVRIGRTRLPFVSGGSPSAVFGGWNLMIPQSSRKKEEVADFVRFLLRPESQETFFRMGGFLPVIQSFYLDSAIARRYPEISDLERIKSTGVHRPYHADYTKYSSIVTGQVFLALNGRRSIPDALAEATRLIQVERPRTQEMRND